MDIMDGLMVDDRNGMYICKIIYISMCIDASIKIKRMDNFEMFKFLKIMKDYYM